MPEKSFVISVLNMKGGVGKTTLAANVFHEVFLNHKLSTLLIDFDPQYNLSQMLLSRKKYESLQDNGHTLFRVMEQAPPTNVLAVCRNDLLDTPSPTDISHKLKIFKSGEKLDLIAGDFNLVRFNLRENDGLDAPRKRLEKFIKEAKKQYKIIVLDCNPSSSFLTRTAIENATHLLIPVRPDRYSVLGLDLINEFIDILPTLSKRPELLILMNDIPYNSPPGEVENQIRSHKIYGPACLAARIPTSEILRMKTHHIGFATDRKVAYSRRVKKYLSDAANELVLKLGVQK